MADGDEIPDRVVATALEFAVGIAAAGARIRPALPFPAELKPFLKFTKLPPKALRDVRRVVEGDAAFMRTLASVATPELLDDAGMLWLQRPDGWHDQLAHLVETQAESGTLDAAAELRRADRRRVAAEQASHRTAAELAAVRAELDRVSQQHVEASSRAAALLRERDALLEEVATHRAELRRAIDRLATAQTRLQSQQDKALAAAARAAEAERVRDTVLADRSGGPVESPSETNAQTVIEGAANVAADLAQQAQQARSMAIELGRLAGRLQSLEPVVATPPATTAPRAAGRRRTERKPVALPGGIYGSSDLATEFLVKQPSIVILVDGYNVAKLAWPRLELEDQRERCIQICEDIARRFGAHIAVVFDGTTIAGASAPKRRLVRVSYSPEGVIADDVLRAEVEAVAADIPVLVVTNDQAVLTDVRAMGANTLSSDQWIELGCR